MNHQKQKINSCIFSIGLLAFLAPSAFANRSAPEFFLEPHKSLIQVLPQKLEYKIEEGNFVLSETKWALSPKCKLQLNKNSIEWCFPTDASLAEELWLQSPQGERLFSRIIPAESAAKKTHGLRVELSAKEAITLRQSGHFWVCLGASTEGSRWAYCKNQVVPESKTENPAETEMAANSTDNPAEANASDDSAENPAKYAVYINGDLSSSYGELLLERSTDLVLLQVSSRDIKLQFEIHKQDLQTLEITAGQNENYFTLVTNNPMYQPKSKQLENGKWQTQINIKEPRAVFKAESGIGIIVDLFFKNDVLPDPGLKPTITYPPIAKTYSQRPTIEFKANKKAQLIPSQKGSNLEERGETFAWTWPSIPVSRVSTRTLEVDPKGNQKSRLSLEMERGRNKFVELSTVQTKSTRPSLALAYSWDALFGNIDYLRSLLYLQLSSDKETQEISLFYLWRFPRGLMLMESGHYLGIGANSVTLKEVSKSTLLTGAQYLGWYQNFDSWRKYFDIWELKLNYYFPKTIDEIKITNLTQASLGIKKTFASNWFAGFSIYASSTTIGAAASDTGANATTSSGAGLQLGALF